MMAAQTAREKLRAFMVRYPNATAAQAARGIAVTRQRVHKIAAEEEISFGDGTPGAVPPDLGSELAPPRLAAAASTGAAADSVHAAILRVASDLAARGFEVFVSVSPSSHDVVAHDPGTGRFEGFSVQTGRPRGTGRYDQGAGARRAFVLADGSVEYRPGL